ncbi:uncharacterized protein LTR77_009443 [Saxophila tyrrhenica]|uniref:Uncharacterized protein n=1 Tax=Saxophila tyrrhenica TaxID=1690608 RepID=A0AAV9NXN6_9PEZI|nr:hypothetical protein LTR77_009443 [Saxophila tyrrhenica]
MHTFSLVAALVASTSAAQIRLYPNSFGCSENTVLICRNVGNTCCGQATRNFSSGVLLNGRSNQRGLYWVRGAGANNLCGSFLGAAGNGVCYTQGERGGITGGRVGTAQLRARRNVEELEDTADSACEMVLPDVLMVDGQGFYINHHVPETVSNAMMEKVDAGTSAAELMVEFAEYSFSGEENAALL